MTYCTSTLTPEDMVAYRLRGFSLLVKCKDGEEILVKLDEDADIDALFVDVDNYLNGTSPYLPFMGLSVSRDCIKYVIRL